MRLIAEGTDDDDTDAELRLDAVCSYLELLEKPHLPDILVKIICWVSDTESIVHTGVVINTCMTIMKRGWLIRISCDLILFVGLLHVRSSIGRAGVCRSN